MSQSHHHDHTQGRGRQRISKKNLFTKDLPSMMFGFGDPDPQREVVALMEEMVIDHISDVLISAHKVSTNRGKLKVDDIKFALQSSSTRVHNPSSSTTPEIMYASYPLARRKATLEEKQLSRIEELLFMQEDLARARGRADDLKAYGEDEPNEPGGAEPIEMDSNYLVDKGKQRDYRI
ncbi:hypothetical protein DFH28DRAFT_1079901 [Melampsora americana]|nr:hypothetical protein DFH28DRAFT_1079901 [Melampsora americana]